MEIKYTSEFGQDRYLDEEVFKGKENGVFIEVGACDGVYLSNSYFFEKFRNWTGICIEPRKSQFDILQTTRSCICERACISDASQEEFIEFEGGWLSKLSGIQRHFHPEHQEKVNEGMNYKYHKSKKFTIMTTKLDSLLLKYGITHVDYCSVDTEGSELNVLKTIDFNRTTFDVFSIENNYGRNQVYEFMTDKGYEKIHEIGRPNYALDEIYKRKS